MDLLSSLNHRPRNVLSKAKFVKILNENNALNPDGTRAKRYNYLPGPGPHVETGPAQQKFSCYYFNPTCEEDYTIAYRALETEFNKSLKGRYPSFFFNGMKEEDLEDINMYFKDDTIYVSSFTILLKNNPYLIKHDDIISLSPHEPTVWSRELSDKSMLDECISGTMITGPYVECSGKTLDESRFRMLIKNGKAPCPTKARHLHHEEEILPGNHKSQLSLFISEMKSMASHEDHGYFGVHDVTELAHSTESTLHTLHHGLEKGHLAPLLMKSVGDCVPVVGAIIGTTEVIEHGKMHILPLKMAI